MSGSSKPEAPPAGAAAGDPSMEDILASIRRILSEDEPHPTAGAEESVLVLDESMLRPEAPAAEPVPDAAPEPETPAAPPAGLVAPEAAAAAAASVGSLLRALASDRALQVRTGGPTIEDIVRQSLRPLLKDWLDANLPALVERLVRAEIERVVNRSLT